MIKENKIQIFKPNDEKSSSNIFIKDGISAGFPSPASDFEESRISLEKVLVKNKEATAICYVNGEFTVKRIRIEKNHVYLVPENKKYSPIKITEENEFIVWGIVTYVIKKT